MDPTKVAPTTLNYLLPPKSDYCNGFTSDVHTAPEPVPTHQTEHRDAPGNPACYGDAWRTVHTTGTDRKSASSQPAVGPMVHAALAAHDERTACHVPLGMPRAHKMLPSLCHARW